MSQAKAPKSESVNPANNNDQKKMPPKSNDNDLHLPDPALLTKALARVWDRAQPVFNELWAKHLQDLEHFNFDPMNIRQSYMEFLDQVIANPEKIANLQINYWSKWMQLWQDSSMRILGEASEAQKAIIEPDKGDRRFKSKEWQENTVFDFIKQSYLLTSECMINTIEEVDGLEKKHREKLKFFAREYANALSPTNFVLTNPDVLKETLRSGGENLIKGFENLLQDIERGQGELKISTTNYGAFQLGENIATTKGSVVYQNDLIQLIQYEPQTDRVKETPMLIIPPWINKYYILDLKADNSYIEYAVQQGYTVFTISWVNPDAKMARKSFENYLNEGIFAALDEIKKITGEDSCHAAGYCLGGTLLTIALSVLHAQKQEKRIKSATFLTTLIDFEDSGELTLFMDDEQIKAMEEGMSLKGVLEAKKLQQTFSLLRSNDLIWSFVVNNYLLGREPFPFDLLYWNDDSTNMPAAMHSFYLQHMYRDNDLVKPGVLEMNGEPINITSIKTPSYFLSTREDHIAPWKSTYKGPHHFSGPKTFTLAASGHIAGVVNAPKKNKYCYWTSDDLPQDPDAWFGSSKEHKGSWWPHWKTWLSAFDKNDVPPRKIKNALEAAPGSYVKKKS